MERDRSCGREALSLLAFHPHPHPHPWSAEGSASLPADRAGPVYQWIAQLSFARDSWTAPTDAVTVDPWVDLVAVLDQRGGDGRQGS